MPRVLSEADYNAIQQQVLASMPRGLSEQDYNHMLPSVMAGAIATAENMPATPTGSGLGRFVSGMWQNLNPMGLAEALVSPDARMRMATDVGLAHLDQYQKMRAAPTTSEAIGHGAAMVLPIAGPAAAKAGETIASGDYAGGAGQTAGLLAPFAHEPMGAGLKAVREATSAPADAVLGALLNKTIGDPTAIDLATTRLRMQAARSGARQVRLRGQIADLSKPAPLTAEQVAAQAASGHAPAPPASVPGPFGGTTTPASEVRPVSGPQGVPASQAGPEASVRAEAASAANPRGRTASAPPETSSAPAAGATAEPAFVPRGSTRPPSAQTRLEIAARRGQMDPLSATEMEAATSLVNQGHAPEDVVRTIADLRAGSTPSSPALTRDEGKVFQDLMDQGKTPEQAMQVIELGRKLQQVPGVMTESQAADDLAHRKTTGRWRTRD